MKKVLLLNVWHDDNIGDSAIAQTCIEAAMRRWPDAILEARTMMSAGDPAFPSWNRHLSRMYPEVVFLPAFYPEPHSSGKNQRRSVIKAFLLAVSLALGIKGVVWKAAKAHIADAEAVVVVGGSDIFEVRRPFTSKFRLIRITQAATDAAVMGVPVFLWGHTLGPFETKTGRRIAARLLKSATQVLVRDEPSQRTAERLAPGVDVQLVPDFGFYIQPTPMLASQFRERWGRYVALVPRRHFFDDDGARTERLLDHLAEFSTQLLNRGEVDGVVLVAQVVGPSIVEDDRIVVDQLVRKIDDERIYTVETQDLGPSELCALYSGAVGVVSVRLHGAILSMAGGTPALAISYFTGKTSGVMDGLGLSDSWVEFDDCSTVRLVEWWRLVSFDSARIETIHEVARRARRMLATEVLRQG